MSRNPNTIPPRQQPQPQVQPPPPALPARPARRGPFHWFLIAIPATCAVYLWLMSGIKKSISFDDIAHAAGASDHGRYGMLAIWGVLLICATLLIKASRR